MSRWSYRVLSLSWCSGPMCSLLFTGHIIFPQSCKNYKRNVINKHFLAAVPAPQGIIWCSRALHLCGRSAIVEIEGRHSSLRSVLISCNLRHGTKAPFWGLLWKVCVSTKWDEWIKLNLYTLQLLPPATKRREQMLSCFYWNVAVKADWSLISQHITKGKMESC